MQKGYIFFLIFFLIAGELKSQGDTSEIIIGEKLFSTHSSWLSAGAGAGFYAEKQTIDPSFSFDINVYFRKHYITAGYFYSGTRFITQYSARKVHNYHIGYGWRRESIRWHSYLTAGPALCMGYGYYKNDEYGEPLLKGFIEPGVYAEYQIVWKPIYDMGLGLAAYTSLNFGYQTAGIKAILYLSTAYIGSMKVEDTKTNQPKIK
jgi:hypothetical protein